MENTDKLGIWRLTAIVFGSVIGGSIFNIAQNMAHGAALGAVLCAWGLTGVGILFLVVTFQRLCAIHPELKAGIYQYAQVGFGNYAGFNMAWGYWLCVIFGNVTYAVLLNDSIGAFVPAFLEHGWLTFLFGTALIWVIYYIVTRGIRQASYVNTLLSILKFACIVFILVILSVYAKLGMFSLDFWGRLSPSLGSFGSQVSSCMLVTIWSFLGIEGAVMMSARAKKHSDVSKATMHGFLYALALYVLVTLLCFGVMTQQELAGLPTPSLAYVLDSCAGHWAKWFVVISIIISVAGGFIAWSLLCAQVPYEAAQVKIFPEKFLSVNRHGVPDFGMIVASVAETLCLLLVITAENVYLAAVNLASMMVLPCYFFCGLYLLKIAVGRRRDGEGQDIRGTVGCKPTATIGELTVTMGEPIVTGQEKTSAWRKWALVFVAVMTMVYCGYSMWAGSLWLLMLTSVFYLAGTPFLVMARRQCQDSLTCSRPTLRRGEMAVFFVMLALSVVSVWMLCTGSIALDG